MKTLKPTFLLSLLTLCLLPSLAIAAPAAPAAAAESSSGVTGLLAALTALVSAVAALAAALRGSKRAKQADERAAQADERAEQAHSRATQADERSSRALAWADRVANATQDGVVLVLSYPGARASCRGLLETNGWQIQHYSVTQAELDRGALLPGPHVIADVCAADAIVIEGLDPEGMAKLAALREFRDNIRSGCGVSLYTGGQNFRYDLTLWGECDQGVTTPVTTEAAVRASLARREATARRQGIRPGQLAAARKQLLTQTSQCVGAM